MPMYHARITVLRHEPMEIVVSGTIEIPKILILSGIRDAYTLDELRHATADDRPSTYTCVHCNATALKSAWGPGRITCPGCGKMTPSASEKNETKAPAV